jgi:hypothetical protein
MYSNDACFSSSLFIVPCTVKFFLLIQENDNVGANQNKYMPDFFWALDHSPVWKFSFGMDAIFSNSVCTVLKVLFPYPQCMLREKMYGLQEFCTGILRE